MQGQFERIRDEFSIKQNMKEEFCMYTGARIKNFVRELDKKYETLKKKLEEHMQMKLVQDSGRIELFHSTYNGME